MRNKFNLVFINFFPVFMCAWKNVSTLLSISFLMFQNVGKSVWVCSVSVYYINVKHVCVFVNICPLICILYVYIKGYRILILLTIRSYIYFWSTRMWRHRTNLECRLVLGQMRQSWEMTAWQTKHRWKHTFSAYFSNFCQNLDHW